MKISSFLELFEGSGPESCFGIDSQPILDLIWDQFLINLELVFKQEGAREQTSKQASEQASKPASEQASKRANNQASKPATSKQAAKQAGAVAADAAVDATSPLRHRFGTVAGFCLWQLDTLGLWSKTMWCGFFFADFRAGGEGEFIFFLIFFN